MPQMAPMNWLTLFIFFSIILILFNVKNYYNKIDYPQKKTSLLKKLSINWKW